MQMYCKCQYIRFQMQRVGFAAEHFFFSLCCFNGPTNEALNVQLEKQKPRPKNEIFKGLFNCDLLSGRWGLEYRLNDEKQPWLGSNKLLTVNRPNKTYNMRNNQSQISSTLRETFACPLHNHFKAKQLKSGFF